MYPDVFTGGYGLGYGPEAFMAWADSLDSFIAQNQVSSLESLSLAVSLLRGESRAWWWVEEEARWCEEEQIHTWDELKIIMSFKYVPGFQWEEEELDFDFYLEEIAQPDSLPEDSFPMIAAEHEGETQELCLHVPDQTNQEDKVLGESSTTPELAHALIDQGGSFQSLSSGLLTCPITDQNQLRSTKQKLAMVKKMPKLENEYGDHYTRPPDPMQHENQVIMSIGQGVLREIIDILLGSHKELVRPPDQSARFLLNNATEVQSIDRAGQTDRAVYRLDPHSSGLELQHNSRPDGQIKRTEARLFHPVHHANPSVKSEVKLVEWNSNPTMASLS
ncbi:hypothetical protein DY000_02046818 [Brassica cretica]|uniref:Retrotransposon gag domain-containing protein n=1 Tax=Brassica cretica TaxID=69181 RepID=A0ABQ7F0Z3_BRACR|nr:hypothetical protein DY000_02046818 [Brassica cretica]